MCHPKVASPYVIASRILSSFLGRIPCYFWFRPARPRHLGHPWDGNGSYTTRHVASDIFRWRVRVVSLNRPIPVGPVRCVVGDDIAKEGISDFRLLFFFFWRANMYFLFRSVQYYLAHMFSEALITFSVFKKCCRVPFNVRWWASW